jgi:hypothetical protein
VLNPNSCIGILLNSQSFYVYKSSKHVENVKVSPFFFSYNSSSCYYVVFSRDIMANNLGTFSRVPRSNKVDAKGGSTVHWPKYTTFLEAS